MSDTRYTGKNSFLRRIGERARDRSKFVCRCRANVFFFCLCCLHPERAYCTHANTPKFDISIINVFVFGGCLENVAQKMSAGFSIYIYMPPVRAHFSRFPNEYRRLSGMCVKMARIEREKKRKTRCIVCVCPVSKILLHTHTHISLLSPFVFGRYANLSLYGWWDKFCHSSHRSEMSLFIFEHKLETTPLNVYIRWLHAVSPSTYIRKRTHKYFTTSHSLEQPRPPTIPPKMN